MEQQRRYSQEFKRSVVLPTEAPGVPTQPVAEELGIGRRLWSRWRSEPRTAEKKAFSGQDTPRDEKMAVLNREFAPGRKEPDRLKEAAAFFEKTPK